MTTYTITAFNPDAMKLIDRHEDVPADQVQVVLAGLPLHPMAVICKGSNGVTTRFKRTADGGPFH